MVITDYFSVPFLGRLKFGSERLLRRFIVDGRVWKSRNYTSEFIKRQKFVFNPVSMNFYWNVHFVQFKLAFALQIIFIQLYRSISSSSEYSSFVTQFSPVFGFPIPFGIDGWNTDEYGECGGETVQFELNDDRNESKLDT